MKAMVILACVALGGVSTGKMLFPAKSAVPPPPVAKPQPIRVVDTTPFRVRWEPMQGQPAMLDQSQDQREIPVRTIPIRQQRDTTYFPSKREQPREPEVREPDVREPVRSPQRRIRNIRYAQHTSGGEKSTCIRVHMRTVYTNGGRSWRCRK